MKTCTSCEQCFPLSSFGANKQAKDGLSWACKKCVSIRARENHKKRQEDPLKKRSHNDRIRNRAQQRKAWVVERVYGGHCYDCSQSFPPCVFDFHHVGNKEDNPSVFLGRHTLADALAELESCVMLCSNCHRMRHFHKDLNDTTD